MLKRIPALGLSLLPGSGKLYAKVALGGLLLASLLGYQPTFGFPPVKRVKVYAQAETNQSVIPASLPIGFQLPHPGYLSTPYSLWHPGIDIATGLGMPIHPIAPGTVVEAGYNFWGLGLMVEVDHGHGYVSTYGHMGRIYVQKGQTISDSDLLGEVGLTGHTTGPHTHLEVRKNGQTIDPQALLPTVRQMPVAADFQAVGGRR